MENREDHNRESGHRAAGLKSSEGGRGNPEKASPAAIERYIKGIHFPADKDDLLQKAKSNGAPQDVLNVLNRFTEKEYSSVVEVAKETPHAEG